MGIINSDTKDTTLLIGEDFISHDLSVHNGELSNLELKYRLSISLNGIPSFPKINADEPLRIKPLNGTDKLLLTIKKEEK